MYDYCIVGGGIVGKYIAYQLRDKNTVWVSGRHANWMSTDVYQLRNYLGEKDTWQEKATGLISFPSSQDVEHFPFSRATYDLYQQELRAFLQLRSLESVAQKLPYQSVTQVLSEHFCQSKMNYFWSGHQCLEGPSFDTREPYEEYWAKQKPQWQFMEAQADDLQVDYLVIEGTKAVAIVGRDGLGREKSIKARHFILACHTPGNIALINQTYAKYRLFTENIRSIGQYFSDHLQLSFGFLVPKIDIPRTTINSLCFQDYEIAGLRFRLEFHFAPPRELLIYNCLQRLPEYRQEDFFHHFIRIVAIAEFPPMAESYLQLQAGNRYRVSKQFTLHIHRLKTQLAKILKEQIFTDHSWVLLNRHQPLYFGGHLIGGTSFPYVLNEQLTMRDLANVSIGGSSAMLSGGLFNPTFTSLVFAQHLVNSLPSF